MLSERLTTMLGLGALVHVWNRCPTDAVKGRTPYQLWTGTKPNVSLLRVWGCTAYVHIQKDKREGLGSHMEKCVFIGYPQRYKGWKFYNPTTKKTIISERADFDERYFPMSKRPIAATVVQLQTWRNRPLHRLDLHSQCHHQCPSPTGQQTASTTL